MDDIKVKLIRKICHIDNEQLLNDINQFIILKINEYATNAKSTPVVGVFEIGDEVVIINTGSLYSTYDKMFEQFNFKNTVYNDISDKEVNLNWTVFGNPTKHENGIDIVVPIRSNKGHEILIDSDGILKIEK